MKKRLRIAYILGPFPQLSQTFIHNELQMLHYLGADTLLFSLTSAVQNPIQSDMKTYIPRIIYAPKTIYLPFWKRWALLARSYPSSWAKLWRVSHRFHNHYFLGAWLADQLKNLDIDGIHAHFPEPSLAAYVASLITGIPFSFTVHSHLHTEQKYCLSEKIRASSFVVAVGNNINDKLTQIAGLSCKNKIHVIYSGLFVNKFSLRSSIPETGAASKNTTLKLVSVGRLVTHKGFMVLLKAVRGLLDIGITTTLSIIGDGPMKTKIRKEIRRMKLEKQVHLHGSMTQNKRFFAILQKADIFVLPCITENNGDQDGLPVAILEAMALQKPIVSTSISSIPEAVNSSCGILVEEKNVQQLTQALIALSMLSTRDRRKLGRAARLQIIRKFNALTNYKNLYSLFLSHYALTR